MSNKYAGRKYIFPILVRYYDTPPLKLANRIKDYFGYSYKAAKRISKRIGFDGYFSYYSARYSSATHALNEGADRNTVSHLFDYEKFSTIDNHADRTDDDKVGKAMEILRLQ